MTVNGLVHPSAKLAVAFCHPDLGLGGAERLVVDAAVELAERGHKVDVFTAHYDPHRCFKETQGGAFRIFVRGSWFPRSVLGRLVALCAYVRCLLAAAAIVWRTLRRAQRYDVVFVDQVSVVIPLLRCCTRAKVLFYCHFPDLLLAQHSGRLRAAYRAPLDWIEQATTGQAHKVLVNSVFTRGVFAQTFRRLAAHGVVPEVLHPAVHEPSSVELRAAATGWRSLVGPQLAAFLEAGPVFVSINRFERKKDLALAVRALAELLRSDGAVAREPGVAASRLVVAGGYDARLAENREHLCEIRHLAASLGVAERVWLLPSFSDEARGALLAVCRAVVYTPQREHFGIVPLEAMAAGRPVVACASGGPLESICHGATGFLCPPEPAAFARVMARLAVGKLAETMGKKARAHVLEHFTRRAFGANLEAIVTRMVH